jgi:hypothetical protein
MLTATKIAINGGIFRNFEAPAPAAFAAGAALTVAS